uniref:Uncharacterized protein n=2 Tax=Lotharella globosa TaxID=91324 RepID=A0A7S4DXM0_9EUKA|eukprot:CAMPEP_0167786208 /NCGR_PEP_ID=MMETSP0111_2-20121227/8652_1 /TAXON_ID=91324 /ORGANISM="Lotharella globosa, Strain CCCM811" /LENGTH=351 /DNA_ID=CAMNT_0007677539 /DNA_START=93 /DNA_END=1148 /DNA_ORIENTATION=-
MGACHSHADHTGLYAHHKPGKETQDILLPCAVLDNDLSTVKRMLTEEESRTDFRYEKGETLLHIAAGNPEQFKIVVLLLKMKADLTASDAHGRTPLHIACKCGVFNSFNEMSHSIDFSARIWKSLIHDAVRGQNLCIVKKLVRLKADLNECDESNRTALHIASNKGCPVILRFLLEHRANVNQPDAHGHTPLLTACRSFQSGAVAILLEAKADMNASSVKPLVCTVRRFKMLAAGHVVSPPTKNVAAVLQTLITSKADPTDLCELADTPRLYWAVMHDLFPLLVKNTSNSCRTEAAPVTLEMSQFERKLEVLTDSTRKESVLEYSTSESTEAFAATAECLRPQSSSDDLKM